jgi:hypothetical protein
VGTFAQRDQIRIRHSRPRPIIAGTGGAGVGAPTTAKVLSEQGVKFWKVEPLSGRAELDDLAVCNARCRCGAVESAQIVNHAIVLDAGKKEALGLGLGRTKAAPKDVL